MFSPGPPLLEIEETEAVDDPDHSVVQPLLHLVGAEVCVLPDDPARHQQPVSSCTQHRVLDSSGVLYRLCLSLYVNCTNSCSCL